MFCDLVGFMAISQRVDPEVLHREILLPYQEVCSRAIVRSEGHVAQYLGDCVLAFFGYPRAHENDAENAVRAALEIQAALSELNERVAGVVQPAVRARIGIHTGRVVVSEVRESTHHDTLAFGEAINVASRIQALAEPGGILIGQSTHQLVSGLFATRDLGTPPLKGVTEPIRVYSVVGSTRAGPRFATASRLTPLTGRERELRHFADRWKRAVEGDGQVLMVTGEPGIGKSRLLRAFYQELEGVPHFTLELRCSPHRRGSAFQPVIELYEQGLGLSDEDAPAARLAKLGTGLERILGLDLAEVVPYLAALFGLPASNRFPLEHLGPEVQRKKTLDALIAPILALAEQPVLLAVDDLHWSDPSTLELLGRLVERIERRRILMILTFRPEFQPPWRLPASWSLPLVLSALTRDETRILVAAVAGSVRLPDRVVDRIVERADGVPLFAEELARAVVDSGLIVERDGRVDFRGHVEDRVIPTTLQDSLMARLDRLSAAKHIAQLASVLGREFSLSLMQLFADVDPDALQKGLEQLVKAEILLEQGEPPDSTYTFKHALLQDTAYDSQLKSHRRKLHARVAAILKERFPRRVEAEPEEMARHCAAGGLVREAVSYYRQAGERAAARFSNPEAIEHFRRALELLLALPEDEEHNQKEVELRLALGNSLAALRGYEDPEAEDCCRRVETLCERIESGPKRLPALLGLTLYNVNRGHIPRARDHAEALLRIAEPLGIAPLLVAGHMIKGTASLTTATATEGCRDLERAIEIARTAELRAPTLAYEVDPLAVAQTVHAIGLVTVGRPERALASAEEGIRRARELGHPRTLASALVNASMASTLLEDVKRTRALTDECLRVVTGRGFHTVECSARVQAGWARVRLGDPDGVGAVEAGLELTRVSGSRGGLVQLYFIAAESYKLAGRFEDAFEALEHGHRLIEDTGEWIGFGPQIPTIRARILLASGAGEPAEVERLLVEAFELWGRGEMPWMQLECAILLARLAPSTGRSAEARERLAGIHARFTEGFGTPRMHEARALLAELA
jgi:class 3 adenylate cyclase/tetratricopeptide (TPR) repeat protein